MLDSIQDHLRRALVPRLVIRASNLRMRQKIAATAYRVLKRPLRIELYFAFDDAHAAIALPGLARLAAEYPVQLVLYPLVHRGIEGDPARAARLAHSIKDADLLAGRDGRTLSRTTPLAATDCSHLACWVESARQDAAVGTFAAAAIEQLWFGPTDPNSKPTLVALFKSLIGRDPPTDELRLQAELASNTRRLHAKGHWESPAANVCGEWFFAHERLAQIAERLEKLTGKAGTR